ncbi:MAG: DUF4124 domain-containing protein [Thiogranum sp.]
MYRGLHLRQAFAPLIGLVVLNLPADAREIYKWVAPDGTTQYGEVLPDASIGGFEVLEVLPAPPPPPSAVGDYRSALELADKLEAARLARERLRLERERLSLQQRRTQLDEAASDAEPAPYYVPLYPYARRPFRPPPYAGHPRPHPPWRPPRGRNEVPMRVYPGN